MIYFSGRTELELPETRKRMGAKASFVNIYPFVWKEFQENGYVTGESNSLSLTHSFSLFYVEGQVYSTVLFFVFVSTVVIVVLTNHFSRNFVQMWRQRVFWCHSILSLPLSSCDMETFSKAKLGIWCIVLA